jgi:hypothetical protein
VKAVLDQAEITYPWLLHQGAKFVAKPDQLIKRRGKSGLLALNKTWPEAKQWVADRAGKTQKVEHTEGVLRQFLVEPFVPHPEGTEYYINVCSPTYQMKHPIRWRMLTLVDQLGSRCKSRVSFTLSLLSASSSIGGNAIPAPPSECWWATSTSEEQSGCRNPFCPPNRRESRRAVYSCQKEHVFCPCRSI